MIYKYQLRVYRNGVEILCQTKELDGPALSYHGVEISRKRFLELMNRWNASGLLGIINGGPLYLHIALPEGS